jgi:hypothetical protein
MPCKIEGLNSHVAARPLLQACTSFKFFLNASSSVWRCVIRSRGGWKMSAGSTDDALDPSASEALSRRDTDANDLTDAATEVSDRAE